MVLPGPSYRRCVVGLTFTDIFCGAGGSSIGLTAAGFELRLAANHWARAIETHAANFHDA
ncbi:MAG TPA: DNA cytosine methyltransferase, partial [Pseudonocardiaceae bacterium]|nr:DNA cytosine methyltransferase [Pseudonocardiaceae bacterium]